MIKVAFVFPLQQADLVNDRFGVQTLKNVKLVRICTCVS